MASNDSRAYALMPEGDPPLRVVLAPDKFKGSLTAYEVADAVAAGMRDALPGLETILLPVADGGDGTVAAALSAGFDKIIVDTVGPTGEPVQAPYALQDRPSGSRTRRSGGTDHAARRTARPDGILHVRAGPGDG